MYTHADWLVGPVDVRVVCHFQMHRPRVPTEARMCAQPWTQQIRGCRGGGEAGYGRGPLWVSPWATMRLRDCFQNSFSAGPVETAGEQVVLLNCTLYSGRGGELYVACVSHAHTHTRAHADSVLGRAGRWVLWGSRETCSKALSQRPCRWETGREGGHGVGLGSGEGRGPWGRRSPGAGLQAAVPKADSSGLSWAAPKMPAKPLPGLAPFKLNQDLCREELRNSVF